MNDNVLNRVFTYIFLLVLTIISLWLSYKIDYWSNFLIYGILALILAGIVILSSITLTIKSSVNFNYIDLAFSILLLGLNVWSVFSCFKLWL